MAGLVPAINVFGTATAQDVDPRTKSGDDEEGVFFGLRKVMRRNR
jgi:hypothetical protein